MEEINWSLIMWIGGGFGSVITVLLAWIGYLQQSINRRLEIRMNKQDDRIDGQDKKLETQEAQIHELALSSRETLTILKAKLKL